MGCVNKELLSLPEEEFKILLKKHEDGDIAKMIEETGYLDNKIKDYKHKKTGKIYKVSSFSVINATNENVGEQMVLYHCPGQYFVREYNEFMEKFEVKLNSESEKYSKPIPGNEKNSYISFPSKWIKKWLNLKK